MSTPVTRSSRKHTKNTNTTEATSWGFVARSLKEALSYVLGPGSAVAVSITVRFASAALHPYTFKVC